MLYLLRLSGLYSPTSGVISIGNKEKCHWLRKKYIDILGVQLPVYNIPVTYGRDISNMIEVAIYDHKLKSEGYNSANDYMKNYNKILKKDK